MKFGVESGGSVGIGAVVSSGPSLNIGSALGGLRLSLPSFEPSLASLGPKLEGPTQSLVSEGPVKGGLDMFKPIGQINFNQPKLNAADAVAEAQSILTGARPQPEVAVPDVNLDPKPIQPVVNTPLPHEAELVSEEVNQVSDEDKLAAVRATIQDLAPSPSVRADIAPAVESSIKQKGLPANRVQIQPQLETKTAQAVQTSLGPVLEPVIQEQQIEELIEEEVVTKASEEDLKNIEEKESELKMFHSVDPKALEKRKNAVEEAIMKVEARIVQAAEAKQKGVSTVIDGEEIVGETEAKQSTAYRGEELNKLDLRGNLPDGSWEVNLIKIKARKFNSIEEALQQTPKTLAEDPPVREGGGKPVTDKNVAISLKYVPEVIHPAQIVYKRVVRKEQRVKIIKNGSQPAQIVPVEEKIVERIEGTLPLELATALQAPQVLTYSR